MTEQERAVWWARRLLEMLGELHRRGYQRLRFMPAISPSGMHWRCVIAPVEAFSRAHGARLAEWSDEWPRYTTGDGGACFEWTDATDDGPVALADKFVARFPEIVARGWGEDAEYVGWFAAMLAATAPAGLPYAWADWDVPDDRLPVEGAGDNPCVPLPPPGEAPDQL